jgi:transcriptional regulator with XRE-family HTH domain
MGGKHRNAFNGAAGALAKHIGLLIIELRLANDWSQHELARRSGVPQANISLIERGIRFPPIHSLHKIALTFEVPIATFFREPKRKEAVHA